MDAIVLVISMKRVTRVLLLAVACVTIASAAARYVRYIWGSEGPLYLLNKFDVGQEANIPTWYSSFTLLLCSFLLATIAAVKKRNDDRYTLHWGVLSVVFLLLSVDEVAELHEIVGDLSSVIQYMGYPRPSGLIYFFWVVPYSIFGLIVLLAYVGFFVHLPRMTRRLFFGAAALFVLAIGTEMLGASQISPYGLENWENVTGTPKLVVGILTTFEELFEMLGVFVFIYALLSYIGSYVREITVQVDVDKE